MEKRIAILNKRLKPPGEYMTLSGKMAFVLTLFFVLSLQAESRINLGGLLVHPFLFVIPIAIVISQVNIFNIPAKVLYPLLLFFLFLSLANLQNNNPFSEIFKVAASILTFLFFAVSIKTEKDFRVVAVGFVLLAGIIGVTGFNIAQEAETSRLAGVNVLEGLGNKNAQSLFTLPGLFLGLYLMFYLINARKYLLMFILAVVLFFIIVQFFLSANRSGWLGLLVIFVAYMIYSGLNRTTIFAASFVILCSYIAVEIFASDIVEYKRKQTVEGYSSDNARKVLIVESFKAGLENPVFGKGLEGLRSHLAVAVGVKRRLGLDKIDPHNLLGYLFGGCGFFTLVFFLVFLVNLTVKENVIFFSPADQKKVKKIRMLMISFVVLFVVRSFFSREILYSPTFIGALGTLYALYLGQSHNGKRASTR